MALVPTNIVNNEIDTYGEFVSITVKSSETYSDWGDETATETTTENIKAVYNVYGRPTSSHEEGKFHEGELTFFFRSDQSDIIVGTKITRSTGEVFSIRDVRNHGVFGDIYVIEALVEKI